MVIDMSSESLSRSVRNGYRHPPESALDTENLAAAEVETKLEQLCLTFEKLKPNLVASWNSDSAAPPEPLAAVRLPAAEMERSNLEIEK